MTDTHRDTRHESFYAQRESIAAAPAERPWLLVGLAGALGPWAEFELVSRTAPDAWTIPGYQSDGLFSLLFAAVALGVALFREGNEPWAWAAFGLMALCALIGLADWFMFAPTERTIPPGDTGTIERLGWGVRVLGVAGPVGALATFLVARRLNRGDF